MMRILSYLFTFLVLGLGTASAQDIVSLTQLKQMVKDGLSQVDEDLYVDGTVISRYLCHNLETNPNTSYTAVSAGPDRRTAYIQSHDGVLGLGIHFDAELLPAGLELPQWADVMINLKGTSLSLMGGVGLSAYDLTKENIVSVTEGKEVRVKEKTVAQLTDDDVFTYVRIKGCECIFKDGSYSNVFEKYNISSPLNKACKPFTVMDGWACTLTDADGDFINILVNGRAPWRRDGTGVHQGVFDVEGILVVTDLPRYGTENLSRYQLRPMSADAFKVTSETTSWKTICKWDWNRSGGELVPSEGKGTMVCNVPGAVLDRCAEANNPKIYSDQKRPDANGLWDKGALSIKAKACDWWNWEENRGNGVFVTFSGKDVKASDAYIAFSFCGGKLLDAENSADFPSFWRVEYTYDGLTWKPMENRTATMRSMIWKSTKPIRGLSYPLSNEVALGFNEHAFAFPENISGRDLVIVRIVPASKTLSTYAYRGSASRANRQDYERVCYVNFGSIIIRYR